MSFVVMLHGSDTYFLSDLVCAEENLARRSCMNTNDLIVTLPENACTLKRCNLPFTCSLSKYHNSTKVTGNIAEVMPSVYLKCETSQMVNGKCTAFI